MEHHLERASERHPVSMVVARIYTDRPFSFSPGALRRAVTAAFPDDPLLHHHRSDGGSDYSLSKVRYLVIDGTAHLVGVLDGCPVVEKTAQSIETLQVGPTCLEVTGCDFIQDENYLGVAAELRTYRSRSPWLGLNQDNLRRYNRTRSIEDRNRLLERILTGNFLSLAKGFGIRIDNRILVKIVDVRPRPVRAPQPFLGFRLRFVSNMILPSYLGLGKMVAKGFGLMVPPSGRL